MSFEFKRAVRQDLPLVIGIAGPTGGGKTLSAFRLAKGLASGERFCVIDTENGRALHYADEFDFDHGALAAPFEPGHYAEAIAAADAEGYPVIVVDSASHEHAGEGGLLDMHEEELGRLTRGDDSRRDSMTMAAWINPKREHKRFVSKLLQVRAHLILCFRAEEKVEIAKEKGKTVIRPKQSLVGHGGWIPVAEKNLPYELTLSLLVTPDAPGVPKPIKLQQQHRLIVPLDRPLSEDAGSELGAWAKGVNDENKKRVAALSAQLLEFADELENRDVTTAAIQKNRADHGDSAHAEWLAKQVERFQAAVDAKTAPAGDIELEPAVA